MVAITVAVLVGCVLATQLLAWLLGDVARMGRPDYYGLYSPTRLFVWSSEVAPVFPGRVGTACLAGLIAGGMCCFALLRMCRSVPQSRSVGCGHGSAEFATAADIDQAGLFPAGDRPTGLIIGGYRVPPGTGRTTLVRYLVFNRPEPVLLYAPSRSAKGVAFVMPNLFCFADSVLAIDMKRELWQLTAGFRRQGLGNLVGYHDPTSDAEGNMRINLLEEIAIHSEFAVKDAQLVAEYLVPLSDEAASSGGASSHFIPAARSLLTAIVLYECYLAHSANRTASVPSILSRVSDPELSLFDYFEEMRQFGDEHCPFADVIRDCASVQLNLEDREFSGVISSLVTPLAKFRDPVLARAIGRSDIRVKDLVEGKQPTSLYITIPPSDRRRLKEYFSLLISVFLQKLTEQISDERYRRRKLLLMLDEFTSLPAMPVVMDALDYLAGFDIKVVIVVQDLEALKRLYGNSETISSNCSAQIAYTPNRLSTAQYLSSMCGTSTVKELNSNRSRKSTAMVNQSVSTNEAKHSRPLMTPDEVMRMDVPTLDENERIVAAGESLIFVRGCRPIRGVQTPYFMDPELLRRSRIPAPRKSDVIHA